jgi:hypothetical protein
MCFDMARIFFTSFLNFEIFSTAVPNSSTDLDMQDIDVAWEVVPYVVVDSPFVVEHALVAVVPHEMVVLEVGAAVVAAAFGCSLTIEYA